MITPKPWSEKKLKAFSHLLEEAGNSESSVGNWKDRALEWTSPNISNCTYPSLSQLPLHVLVLFLFPLFSKVLKNSLHSTMFLLSRKMTQNKNPKTIVTAEAVRIGHLA